MARVGTREGDTHGIRWCLVVAVVLVGLKPLNAAAQGSSACRPADSASVRILSWVRSIVTGTDPASAKQRTAMRLPQVGTDQITYVTDKQVCSKAVSPYNANAAYQTTGTGTAEAPSGQLYVVKVGTVYVVKDPAIGAGKFGIYVTLDSRYRVLWHGLG